MAPASFPARRMAPAPLAGAALALLLLVSALPAPASAQIDFCGAISNITNQCANPSTEDAVNLGLFAVSASTRAPLGPLSSWKAPY